MRPVIGGSPASLANRRASAARDSRAAAANEVTVRAARVLVQQAHRPADHCRARAYQAVPHEDVADSQSFA